MKKTIVYAVAVVMLFAVVSAVSAKGGKGQGMCFGGGFGNEGGFGMMAGPKMILANASELNLTAEQMEKLKKLSDKKPADKDSWKGMKDSRGAINEELSKDKPDMGKIDAMIDEMAKKHAAQMKEHVRFMNETGSILTKEQKEILKKMKEDKKADFKGKKDRAKNK
ncbi:MAG TPA: Spy/CpxP family protein refolding chaperone [Candidatus Goldiibacteriota bacterium]|nr:Spy/CpxP family protein refolding chaperone [Candidatus Goldiibacteriota bacterium]HPN63913.1 Spy/CpxP family protein refolding chaperone [Candidatus Goldiibacteriota bacterium]HRQ44633.1 Spy/CpxP family protein refolding chaperone [Candidatus Goldiibacteriota bacterium]